MEPDITTPASSPNARLSDGPGLIHAGPKRRLWLGDKRKKRKEIPSMCLPCTRLSNLYEGRAETSQDVCKLTCPFGAHSLPGNSWTCGDSRTPSAALPLILVPAHTLGQIKPSRKDSPVTEIGASAGLQGVALKLHRILTSLP